MAFAFTCYGNDETITSTSIYASGINTSYSVSYGETLNLSGFNDSVRFTANPADGCTFTRWVYRVGSTTETVQYSQDNPFSYSGDEDIYIRAEGETSDTGDEEETPTWVLHEINSNAFLNRSAPISTTVTLDRYTLNRIRFSCAYDGEVTVDFKSNIELYGYLSWLPDWVDFLGIPSVTYGQGNGTEFSITRSVEAGEEYYVFFRGVEGGSQIGYNATIQINPPEEPAKPAKWDWTTSNGSATAIQTKDAYAAITGKQTTLNFSHDVWNDLVDKVNEVLVAKGLSWDTFYDTVENTRMTIYPYELTAVKFNSLRNNLDFVFLTGISKVESKDTVYGSYFTTITSCINNGIDTL